MEAREALLDRVSAADGDTEIKDPATDEVIGRHTFGAAADVKAAVDKAAAAQPAWAALTDRSAAPRSPATASSSASTGSSPSPSPRSSAGNRGSGRASSRPGPFE
jgi:hypothetical protein